MVDEWKDVWRDVYTEMVAAKKVRDDAQKILDEKTKAWIDARKMRIGASNE